MSGDTKIKPESRLTLPSRLEDLSRLGSWVEALAAEYAIPDKTRFAIDLCLEEAVSNIIRHGSRSSLDLPITVECKAVPPHDLVFTIEDQAAPFDPLAHPPGKELPPATSIDQLATGGRGIDLMRKFAGSLAYQRLAGGNRLTIGFSLNR
jgi:anti-sigma regulatory factor (Ser/Thr protein kinase)